MQHLRTIGKYSAGAIIIMMIAHGMSSCASSLPTPTVEDTKKYSHRNYSVYELSAGRDLYIAKCSGCHSLHLPQQYTAATWDTILTNMNPRAKVNPKEAEQIRAYLTLYSNSGL
jgi:hypothetical protein